MSDYLSSLAARSLRREPACEPRRAQMFEPRQETSAAPLADEAQGAGLPGVETFDNVAPQTPSPTAAPISSAPAVNIHDDDEAPRPSATTRALSTYPDALQVPVPLETQSPLQTPAQPSQTSHTRTSEEAVPAAAEHPTHSARPFESVPETTPTLIARRAQTQTATHEPQSSQTVNAATEAAAEPHAPRDVLSVPQTSPTPADVAASPRPLVTTFDKAETPRALRADAVDEESREQPTPVVPRAAVEPRAGRFESEVETTVVELEVVPQTRPSKQPQAAVTPTGSDSESLPVRGARLNGIRATARESATQDATTPPIIEVTIGRI
ncbi:MAG: hypothetical protein ACJ74T_11045, partial [Pyrinomonadaceae bacterium]